MKRHVDYVAGTVLPYMHQTPANLRDAVEHFVVEEACLLQLRGLPLIMRHHDGTANQRGEQRPLHVGGRVESMSISGVNAKVLLALAPDHTPEATLCSNFVADGTYRGLSMGNTVSTKASPDTGETLLIKTPTEVSLCREGYRPGSVIEHFMPSRDTLVRLAQAGPGVISGMAERWGYATNLRSRPEDGDRYIDELARLSDERLASVCSTERLAPAPDNLPIRIAASMSEIAAPAQPAETTPAAAAEKPAAVVSTLPETPDVRNAKMMVEEAVRLQKELLETRKELAQAASERAELAKIREEAREKQKQEFLRILRSYEEHAKRAGLDPAAIQATKSVAEDTFSKEPERGTNVLKSALELSIKASANSGAVEASRLQQLQTVANKTADEWFDNAARELAKLREQTRTVSAPGPALTHSTVLPAGSRVPLTAFEPAPAVSSPSSSFEQRFAEKRVPVPMMVEKPAAPLFIRASSDAANRNEYDAVGQFIKQAGLRQGRIPSYREVAYGVAYDYSGQTKAAADGTQVPERRLVPLRETEARVEPANFAPGWAAMLDRAMAENPYRRDRQMMNEEKSTL